VAAVDSDKLVTRWGSVDHVDDGEGVAVLLSHGVLGSHDNTRALLV
jgi:hypothetical protein